MEKESAAVPAAQAVPQPRSLARGDVSGDACKAGVCGGSASYSVAPGMRFYSTFNVPGLPLNASAIENDITFFIYGNIFFDGGPGQCADCRMNQFVPQLMLGQPLYASTGPPAYNPLWTTATTWIFAAQYFMELYPNGTAKAAAGPWFNCTERDVLWPEYALDEAGGHGELLRLAFLVLDEEGGGAVEGLRLAARWHRAGGGGEGGRVVCACACARVCRAKVR
jgi:hypothetical protein